jgi:hypothetical protein
MKNVCAGTCAVSLMLTIFCSAMTTQNVFSDVEIPLSSPQITQSALIQLIQETGVNKTSLTSILKQQIISLSTLIHTTCSKRRFTNKRELLEAMPAYNAVSDHLVIDGTLSDEISDFQTAFKQLAYNLSQDLCIAIDGKLYAPHLLTTLGNLAQLIAYPNHPTYQDTFAAFTTMYSAILIAKTLHLLMDNSTLTTLPPASQQSHLFVRLCGKYYDHLLKAQTNLHHSVFPL